MPDDDKKAKISLAAEDTPAKTVVFDINPENVAYTISVATRSSPSMSSRARTGNAGSTSPGANAMTATQQSAVTPVPGGQSSGGGSGGSTGGSVQLSFTTFFL